MIYFKKLILILLFLNLFACAEQPKKSTVLVPIEERNVPIASEKPSGKAIDSQKETVIAALINDAEQYSNQGKTEQAVATIERALRIEPKNALLWHQLAAVRVQQQKWQQAIVMARKSNALAGANRRLKSDNWALIAAAYDALGNKEKANEARNKQSGQG
ncbi:MAG: tetratricopeptide repeat protein [Gammaproteobacteria bacterium]|jgi:tetratricopeptide (TPR) repeat protein